MEGTWSKSMCLAYADSRRAHNDFSQTFADFSQTFADFSQVFADSSQTLRRLMCLSYADSEMICAYMPHTGAECQNPGFSKFAKFLPFCVDFRLI